MSEREFGAPRKRTARVCFLYIAQSHQAPHSLSVAVAMAKARPDIQVDVAASDRVVLDYARTTAGVLGDSAIGWRLLGPGWLRAIRMRDGGPPKLPMLMANAHMLAGYDVIVAPERTTAALRRLGVRARLVYTQHGAGDRAGPFEARLSQFDLVFAAGAKQRDRMIASGLIEPRRCAVVGYPKFDLVDRLATMAPPPPLFATPRPTVLYNPHFLPALSSWPLWGPAILAAFAGQTRYNLIFAPHTRLFGVRTAPPELARFTACSRIHMDLGGTRASIDMTYVRQADIYLGDVSSQVYEFIREPRPCVFLNSRRTAWRNDQSYTHWSFGAVVERLAGLFPALDAAAAAQPAFEAAQRAGFDNTFDITPEPASVRAARAIADLAFSPRR